MFNSAAIKEHFLVSGGMLYKKRKDGSGKRIKSVRDGRLVTVLMGETLYGADIAWTCYYGTLPMFPVFTLDGDPQNLSQENIVAARLKRLRYRERATPSGLKHPLNPHVAFRSSTACHEDWLERARAYYDADFGLIREMEDSLASGLPYAGYARPVRAVAAKAERAAVVRPAPPQYAAGYRHYWHSGQWVVVPEACHCADDYRVRCAAVLAGAVRFEFDPALGQVQGFDAAGAVVVA